LGEKSFYLPFFQIAHQVEDISKTNDELKRSLTQLESKLKSQETKTKNIETFFSFFFSLLLFFSSKINWNKKKFFLKKSENDKKGETLKVKELKIGELTRELEKTKKELGQASSLSDVLSTERLEKAELSNTVSILESDNSSMKKANEGNFLNKFISFFIERKVFSK